VDSKSKIIIKYMTTSASVHDSQALEGLLEEKDEGQDMHADCAYVGKKNKEIILKYKMKVKIIEKTYKNKPLTGCQKLLNREKSRVRSRV